MLVVLAMTLAPAAARAADTGPRLGTMDAVVRVEFLVVLLLLLMAGWTWNLRRRLSGRARVLEAGKKRYQAMFDHNAAVMFLVDPEDWAILDANLAAADFYGWTREELTSMRIWDLAALAGEEIQEEMRAAKDEGRSRFQSRHRLADGDPRDVEVFSGPVEIEGRKLLCCIVFDVSERNRFRRDLDRSNENLRRANEELRAANEELRVTNEELISAEGSLRLREEEYRNLFQHAPVGIFLTNDLGRALHVNPEMARMVGADSPQDAEERFTDLAAQLYVDPGRRREFLEILERKGEVMDFEYQARRLDGLTAWISMNARRRDTRNGSFLIHGFAQDITRKKEAEVLLRRERDTVTRLLDTSPAGIVFVNQEGVVDFANQRAEAILGLEISSVKQRTYEDPSWKITDPEGGPFPEEDLPFAVVQRTLEPVYGVEHAIEWPGGERVVLSINAAPIFDAQGRFEGMVSALEDITEKRRVRRELVWAKEEAEAASRVKTEFLANMSHEMRTPLNGILGMLQILGTSDLDQEQHRLAATALESGNRLARLVGDIMDISQVEAGSLAIRPASFDIRELLGAVEQLFAPAAEHKGLEFRVKTGPDLPANVVADQLRLQQVLDNLVGNAVKFTDQGSVTLEAGTREDDRGRPCVRFRVADTGRGIPAHKLEDVFQPFVQVEAGLSRSHQGAGLGLSIARRLAGLMGADIHVRSTPGQGTEFLVDLPLAAAEPGPDTGIVREGGTKTPPLTVLVAEDDRINRFTMQKLLESLGHAVVAVENGRLAVEFLQHQAADVVFMDVQMPEMDGIEATRTIRGQQEQAGRKRIPIVALTASAMAGDRERLLEAGMDDYLAKPLDEDELRNVLARLAAADDFGRDRG